ncbi:unnamed protein product [Protopolystoma xenopodis]|uniref:Uncharacterized protein n=1 Tax=Protopolystoma xenopodis TaxID=117903 RepID=A0A3S5FE90_9PLAT|nr:unnamed protein product [Protopolystoma xenopodis]
MSLSSRFSRWPSSGTFWRPSFEHLSANQPSGLCGRINNRLAGAQRRVEYMRMRGPQAKGHAELAVCQVELPLRPEALVENSISENSTSLSTNRYRRWRAQAMQRPDPRFNYPLDRKPAYCAIPNSGLVTPTPTDLEEPLNPTSGSNLSELKKLVSPYRVIAQYGFLFHIGFLGNFYLLSIDQFNTFFIRQDHTVRLEQFLITFDVFFEYMRQLIREFVVLLCSATVRLISIPNGTRIIPLQYIISTR